MASVVARPLSPFQIKRSCNNSSPKCKGKVVKIMATSKFGNFLHLKPEQRLTPLTGFDLPPSDRRHHDLLVIGAGPAGLRLAEQASLRGLSVCIVDPAPLSPWPNNYGSWLDELSPLSLSHCLDHAWSTAAVFLRNDDDAIKRLHRPYGRVDRTILKTHLLSNCLQHGRVQFHCAKAACATHREFDSSVSCNDSATITASLVVDATGFGSRFTEYPNNNNNNKSGFQIAHGILAEVESHPFNLDEMLLMDWRDSHLHNEPYLRADNSRLPTFLYAMPFSPNLVFLEETSLVSRPALSYHEVKMRMAARLRHLGIRVTRVLEEEKCLIPMGGPLPKTPQNVAAVGGAAGMVHPSTGYMLARTMALASDLADAAFEGLGSVRMIRGKALRDWVWSRGVWPPQRRAAREFYTFGMETLLKLDLDGTRSFFDAFFDLDPHYWHGFLSSRLSFQELALLSLSLFTHASVSSKFDIVTKCPLPLAKMVSNLALDAI